MKLSSLSRGFVAVLLLALAANFGVLMQIRHADLAVRDAYEQRDQTQRFIEELLQENDLLAHLVESFATTGDTRYLTTYYDILAVREGEKAPPNVADVALYWRQLIAARRPRPLASGGKPRTLIAAMEALSFSADELASARRMLEVATRLQAIEKIAFAATQGLYDVARGEFVSDGRPDRAYAIASVHSAAYEAAHADLVAAAGRLRALALGRTQRVVDETRASLKRAIATAIFVNVALLMLLVVVVVALRHRVLRPIASLARQAEGHARGEHDGRIGPHSDWVHELELLGQAQDEMARSIEIELARRDRTERDLEAARAQAEQAARAKASFLANMSHEIRTPMNAIIGLTQLALQTELNERQRSYLNKVHGASQGLLGIINDVLDFSKIEAGGMGLERAPMRIEEVVAQACALVRPLAGDRPLELVCEFADAALLGARGTIEGDALRITQVLTNLLSNAIKFTPAGQVRLVVDTVPAADGAGGPMLSLAVADTGIGLSTEQQSRLFREFSQADESTTRRFGGTGLGLAITQRLVTLMGGSIGVRSQPDAGSRFTVLLPLSPLPPAADVAPLPAQAAGARLLVVAAAVETRAALCGLAQHLGVGNAGRLAAAGDAAQALALLARSAREGLPFDLLLVDRALPDAAGTALIERLRALQPAARIYVMAAYGDDAWREQALQAGATATLDKPVLPDDLRRLFGPARAEPAPAEPAHLQGLRLLVAEDNIVNQTVAVELLTGRGAEVDVVTNGRQAIERLESRGPEAYDVVLMDLQMPVLDGIEATRRLRSQPRFDGLPILAFTAHALHEDREASLAGGMQGYLTKPLNVGEMVRALRPYIGRAKRAAQAKSAPAAAASTAAATATVGAVPVASAPPALPGIDPAVIRDGFGGDMALYLQALHSVADSYRAGIESWRRWLGGDDDDELRRAAHTLQGLAGLVGAKGLRSRAIELEHAARARDGAAALAALGPLQIVLAEFVAAVDAHRPASADPL
ncbi:MAG: response regulator [Burkholderiales bacterium]|nr:response regulator [Burkholderiales bacterium]